MNYTIDYLANYPHFAAEIADLKYNQWRYTSPDREYSVWVSEIVDGARIGECPMVLLAISNAELLGFVGLVEIDERANIRDEIWMITLYVKENDRHQGIGTALVKRCLEEVGSMGRKELYLWTDDKRLTRYYEQMGWAIVTIDKDGQDVMMHET